MILKILGWTAAAVVAFFAIGFAVTPNRDTPAGRKFYAQSDAQLMIEMCWKDQARKSWTPDVARLLAVGCEKREADYRETYHQNP